MCPDSHGGFALFITADTVEAVSTGTWIGERIRDFKFPYTKKCWRRSKRAKSGGVVPLVFGKWIHVSMAAIYFKEQSFPVLLEQAIFSV
jgi:hypothetical protein